MGAWSLNHWTTRKVLTSYLLEKLKSKEHNRGGGKRHIIISVKGEMEKLELSKLVNVKWCSHFGKQSSSSSKGKTWSYHMTQQFYF